VAVDTRTFAVHVEHIGTAPPAATVAPRKRAADGPPWALALLLVPALLAGLAALARRRRRDPAPVATIERRQHVMD
jgi:hypothetical protein